MRTRLIINSDAKNEADDQFAIVHALLSPSLEIVGVIPAHFGTHRTTESQAESRQEVDLLLRLLGMEGQVEVADGAPQKIPDPATPLDSPGARLIIREAAKPGPLSVIFLGPLTDMASALLLEPSIQDNPELRVVWIGGGPYDGVHGGEHPYEFNLHNDVDAANAVFASRLNVSQIPWTVYTKVSVGYAELEAKVAPFGELGAYLYRQLVEFNQTWTDWAGIPEIEYRTLGDSPAVGVVLNDGAAAWRYHAARVFEEPGRMTNRVVPGRSVRVADSIDARWLLEDMFAKIQRHTRSV
ncbi:MAG: nucleoside hydrolase [Bifidobacteriaceae bacterium]|jgi:inosine-uridine nucleoside N-ribohydrolase|nr:nucleoside hydrolase [Bifidobacteriaceae bacterium]